MVISNLWATSVSHLCHGAWPLYSYRLWLISVVSEAANIEI